MLKAESHIEGVSISETNLQTDIIIEFIDDRILQISERRCWEFGFAPEELFQILENLYSVDKYT